MDLVDKIRKVEALLATATKAFFMFEQNGPLPVDYTKHPHNALTREIIGAAIEVHRALGPGLLESAYEACLVFELHERGLLMERQKPVNLVYKKARQWLSIRPSRRSKSYRR